MRYQPKTPPTEDDDISTWVWDELGQIEQAFIELESPAFRQFNVAPTKPRDGMTVLADGVNWNPGAGAGIYTYYGAAWHKLG